MTVTSDTPTTTRPVSEDRKGFLHSVFTTALEGGIGYWSRCLEYRCFLRDDDSRRTPDGYNYDLDGFFAVIEPTEDEWGISDEFDTAHPTLRIDAEVVDRGITLFRDYLYGALDHHGKPVEVKDRQMIREGHYWRQFLAADLTNGVDGDFDAEVADQIVQWGLFGQGIYG